MYDKSGMREQPATEFSERNLNPGDDGMGRASYLQRIVTVLHPLLLACATPVFWYVSNAASVIFALQHPERLDEAPTLSRVLLPGVLVARNVPLWADVAVALLAISLAIACLWATTREGWLVYHEVRSVAQPASSPTSTGSRQRPSRGGAENGALLFALATAVVLVIGHPHYGDWLAFVQSLITASMLTIGLMVALLTIAGTVLVAVRTALVTGLNMRMTNGMDALDTQSSTDFRASWSADYASENSYNQTKTARTQSSNRIHRDEEEERDVSALSDGTNVDSSPAGAWGTDISVERRTELEALLQQWASEVDNGQKRGPFDGISLTGADVYWLAARALAQNSDTASVAEQLTRLLKATKDSKLRSSLNLSALHLEGADLREAYLDGASLRGARLDRAYLRRARLDGSYLREAHLEGADLLLAHLEGADLREAHLEGADLREAHLENANLRVAHVEQANLSAAHLEGADLLLAHLERANLREAHVEQANLTATHLEGTDLLLAHLERASLNGTHLGTARLRAARLDQALLDGAHLEGVDLCEAHLEGTDLSRAQLKGADLRSATFDKSSLLKGAVLSGASLDQVTYNGVNLTIVDWSLVPVLGDELTARHRKDKDRKPKDRTERLEEFTAAVRANRVLAVTLRSQGMNEDADRYAYHAQLMQRKVLRRQGKLGQWLFSWLLWALAGYGYRLQRILITYVMTLTAFALVYYLVGLPNEHAPTLLQHVADAYQVSLTALHGRTFFEQFGIGSTLAWVAAAESVCGLVIEAVFTSMLVQRFFAR